MVPVTTGRKEKEKTRMADEETTKGNERRGNEDEKNVPAARQTEIENRRQRGKKERLMNERGAREAEVHLLRGGSSNGGSKIIRKLLKEAKSELP